VKNPAFAAMLACMLIVGRAAVHAQTPAVGLDEAIRNAAAGLSAGMGRDTRVAVVSMEAGSAVMSNHLIDELIVALVNTGEFLVLNRAQLGLVAAELDMHIDGWVDEATAQSIGRFAGVQFILTGAFEPLGEVYRFRVQAIEVETAIIRRVFTANVQNDGVVVSLLGGAGREIAALPRAGRAPRERRPPREPRPPRGLSPGPNWVSGEISFLGAGVRYERDINDFFSVGGVFFWNLLPVDNGQYSLGLLATARFFPWGSPFYLELGIGAGAGDGVGDGVIEFPSLMIAPSLGVRLDIGREGGFFINPFLSLSLMRGERQTWISAVGEWDEETWTWVEVSPMRLGREPAMAPFFRAGIGLGWRF